MANVNETRDELEQILNSPEYLIYKDEKISILTIWWGKIKNWLADLLESLFPSLEKTTLLAGPLLTIIIVIFLILVGATIFFIIRNKQRKSKFSENTPLQSQKEIDWSSTRHISEANQYEIEKNYSLATRHLFLALLIYYNEKEWLEARVWKTNWEYYEELKKVNQVSADGFYDLANFFDEATYGEKEVQQKEYKEFRVVIMETLGISDE